MIVRETQCLCLEDTDLPIIGKLLLAGGNISAIINMYAASQSRTVIVSETQCVCLEDTDLPIIGKLLLAGGNISAIINM